MGGAAPCLSSPLFHNPADCNEPHLPPVLSPSPVCPGRLVLPVHALPRRSAFRFAWATGSWCPATGTGSTLNNIPACSTTTLTVRHKWSVKWRGRAQAWCGEWRCLAVHHVPQQQQ